MYWINSFFCLVVNWNLCSCCETSHSLILSAPTQINTTKPQIFCAKIHAWQINQEFSIISVLYFEQALAKRTLYLQIWNEAPKDKVMKFISVAKIIKKVGNKWKRMSVKLLRNSNLKKNAGSQDVSRLTALKKWERSNRMDIFTKVDPSHRITSVMSEGKCSAQWEAGRTGRKGRGRLRWWQRNTSVHSQDKPGHQQPRACRDT